MLNALFYHQFASGFFSLALQTVPWMDIKVDEVNGHVISVRLCATNLNLRMMRVTKVELVAA